MVVVAAPSCREKQTTRKMASDMARKQMNDLLNDLQVKGDVYMKQLMLEQKRVKDLDEALTSSREQVGPINPNTILCLYMVGAIDTYQVYLGL